MLGTLEELPLDYRAAMARRVSRRDNEGSAQPGQLRFVQVGQMIEPQLKQIRRCPHSGCETQFIG